MIIRARPSAFGLLFVMQGSILPRIAAKVVVVAAVAAAVVFVRRGHPGWLPDATATPFTLLGLGLSIFLGFRNNACYERWWEGRRQWGGLLAESRGLARAIVAVLPDEPGLRARCGRRVIGFAVALRGQLRGRADDAALGAWLPEAERRGVFGARGRPDAVLRALDAEFSRLRRAGVVSDMLYRGLAELMLGMGERQAACERLAGTPTPFAYSLLLHRTAWLFCLLVPFGIAGSAGVLTPVVVAVLAYAFFGLDALGDELEAPFGETENALPLDAMVRGIEMAVLEALGETALPPALKPIAAVLL